MANKRKKRHPNSSAAVKQRAEQAAIADQKDRARKRMDPTARAILLGDLVFLAIVALLEENAMIPIQVSSVCTLIGAALIPVALYFQFVKKDGGSSKRLK